MREPYTQLYVHLVWATWDRQPLLRPDLRPAVYACIQAECGSLRAEVLALGGTEDHVHLLARFPATVPIADLVKQVKGASSHRVTHRPGRPEPFQWQGGYGAFTLARADVPRLRDYVRNQERHHREGGCEPDWEPGNPPRPEEPGG